jgi:predicted P-loop ATPase
LTRAGIDRLKAFVSRTSDRFRPPYGHRVVEQRRQSIFASTVNHTDYLRDETGARRFWPVPCAKIVVDELASVRDQLWGEAINRYRAGECWWLDTVELNRKAEEVQHGRYRADAWQGLIEDYIAEKDSVDIPEILDQVLTLPVARWGQSEQNRVGRCLRAAGWIRRQRRLGRKREWRYIRPTPAQDFSESTGDR